MYYLQTPNFKLFRKDIYALQKISALQRAVKTSFSAPPQCKYRKIKIKIFFFEKNY